MRDTPTVTRISAQSMCVHVRSAPVPNDRNAPRLFSLDDANAILPDLLPLVATMREDAAALRELQEPLRELAERATLAGGIRPTNAERDAHLSACRHEQSLERVLEELAELGVRIKDPERGLLDFPSVRDGELVELCWIYGEDHVAFWHRLDEGFAGRRPV